MESFFEDYHKAQNFSVYRLGSHVEKNSTFYADVVDNFTKS